MSWRPISEAKKDGTPIWAVLHDDLCARNRGRDDLERWQGLHLPLKHSGVADDGFDVGWHIAAPVGVGGFPDEWIAGWMPFPDKPLMNK